MNILITGAASGIGKAAAFALSRRGHQVFATTRTQAQADVLQQEAAASGIALHTFKLDILNEEDQVRAAGQEIDVLINNAALGMSGPIAHIPMEYVRKVFETNIFATLALTQGVAQQMIKKKSGRIVNISSVAGRITLPYLGPYSMTKHAMESMTNALRQELRMHGIHVSAVEPGAIGTGFNEKMNATKYQWMDESAHKEELEAMHKYEQMLVQDQAGVESIVSAIVHAVESKKPKAHYVRPQSANRAAFLAALVPSTLLDWMIRKGAE